MADKSVWFEEVDTALLELLQTSLSLDKDHVFVRKAEKEFKVEVYPSASIYEVNSKYDIDRDDPNLKEVFISKDTTTMLATYEDKSIPFNLSYQIDLWAKYKTDMNILTKKFIVNIPRWFNLDVLDASGNKRSVFTQQRTSLTTRDYMSGADRIYHSTVIFNIKVELDSGNSHTTPLVSNVKFITN